MIKMVEINDSQFDTLVLKSALPVLLECASPECIICKAMSDRIHEAGRDCSGKMIFFRININENRKWQDFSVRVIPTLLYFKNGILVARQDNFPEVEEIREKIRSITKKGTGVVNTYTELKNSLDLECSAARFYKYVSTSTKNGKVKEKFRLIYEETLAHKELLQAKLLELTGERQAFDSANKLNGLNMRPQSFSLLGALKMAVKIEEKLLSFYKKLNKDRNLSDKELFRKLIKEESVHLKAVQREMKFLGDKELFGSMEQPEFSSWLNKIFE